MAAAIITSEARVRVDCRQQFTVCTSNQIDESNLNAKTTRAAAASEQKCKDALSKHEIIPEPNPHSFSPTRSLTRALTCLWEGGEGSG